MTPFAKLSRQLRKEKGLLLGEVASRVGCTPSFLSQVEAGAKAIPDGLVGKLANALSLSTRDGQSLENAAALSAKEFRISLPVDARSQDREMARLLSAGFARMSALKKDRILKILKEDSDA
jgi:transcriptional regulator with XRE-family HTH domain